jgi:hypothetical protein
MKCCDNYKYNPSYAYVKCGSCGAVTLDGGREHGIAARKTFKSMRYAEFYKKNGYRVEDDLKEDK